MSARAAFCTAPAPELHAGALEKSSIGRGLDGTWSHPKGLDALGGWLDVACRARVAGQVDT